MRLATQTTRWLIRTLLITLPWLPLGAVAGVSHAGNTTMSCLHAGAAHPAPDCQQHDSTACFGHCALEHVGVGLLAVAIPADSLQSLAPLPAREGRWLQRHTPPPLRPPRARPI